MPQIETVRMPFPLTILKFSYVLAVANTTQRDTACKIQWLTFAWIKAAGNRNI